MCRSFWWHTGGSSDREFSDGLFGSIPSLQRTVDNTWSIFTMPQAGKTLWGPMCLLRSLSRKVWKKGKQWWLRW